MGIKKIPLYKKCAKTLRQQILECKWEPNDILPTEKELASEFNVSRITIRQAMQLLEEEGLIIRQQGKGTFIPEKPYEQDLYGVHDFAKKQHRKGHRPDFIIENVQICNPNKQVYSILNLENNEKIYKIQRIKLEDENPLMYERIFLPLKYATELNLSDLSEKWLAEILQQKFNLPITKVKYTIEPIVIDDFEASKLMISPQSLGLMVDRISWSQDTIIMFTRSIVRADLVKYTVEINR